MLNLPRFYSILCYGELYIIIYHNNNNRIQGATPLFALRELFSMK